MVRKNLHAKWVWRSLIIRNEILIGPCVLCVFSSDIPKENIWPQSKALSLEGRSFKCTEGHINHHGHLNVLILRNNELYAFLFQLSSYLPKELARILEAQIITKELMKCR